MPVPMLTRRKAVGMLAERLTGLYDPCEARSIARQAAAFYAGITLPALLADPEAEIDVPALEQAASGSPRGSRCNTSSARASSSDAVSPSGRGC